MWAYVQTVLEYYNVDIGNDSDYISSNIIVYQCLTGYYCVLNYCRKVSPLEGSKNRDSLKKLVCVCVEGGTG